MNNSYNNQKKHKFLEYGGQECLIRVHRRFFDRLISLFVPVQRYQCYLCYWEGLIRATSSPKSGTALKPSASIPKPEPEDTRVNSFNGVPSGPASYS